MIWIYDFNLVLIKIKEKIFDIWNRNLWTRRKLEFKHLKKTKRREDNLARQWHQGSSGRCGGASVHRQLRWSSADKGGCSARKKGKRSIRSKGEEGGQEGGGGEMEKHLLSDDGNGDDHLWQLRREEGQQIRIGFLYYQDPNPKAHSLIVFFMVLVFCNYTLN